MREGRFTAAVSPGWSMLIALLASVSVASLLPASAAAKTSYVSLSKVGVKASKAAVAGRTLVVRIEAKRKVTLRLTVLRSSKVKARASPFTFKKGTRTVVKTLNRTPVGTQLKLRVIATRGTKKGRRIIKLKLLPLPVTPQVPPPVTPPPPPTPPSPVNRPPTDIALSNANVPSGQPLGTAVGTLSATDPDAGDTHTFTLVGGVGSTDNAQFQIVGGQLQTNVVFAPGPPRSIRVRATDSSGLLFFEKQFTIAIVVNNPPLAVDDSFDAIGNTGLFVGTTRPAGEAGKVIAGSLLSNDSDPDQPPATLVAEPVANGSTTLGGTITIESDGNFTYHPDDLDTGVTDTFTYRVCDASPCNAGIANSTATLSLPIAGQVWYVRNNAAAGGDGTSDGPFDTLAEAETASSTGDSVFVFDGDNTAASLNSGYLMEANERLVGEHAGISLDPDGGGPLTLQDLRPANAGAHPTLTTTAAEDVVSLASGTTVDGINVDPGGTGGGVGGGAGAGGPAAGNVTVANVNVVDNGTAGTQPGVDLDGTTGTNNLSNIVVSNGGSATAVGVRLNNAGTVNFASAGTVSITTTNARGLDAAGTSMGTSAFDDITVTGSASGGVSMTNTTGTTTFGDAIGTDLSLTTASGTAPAFALSNAGTVTVPSGGTANVSATGGPAVDVTGTSGANLAFDSVSSTGNAGGDGINLSGLGSGSFSATAGTISGAGGISFDVDGGSGDVSYAGALSNGSGQTAEITARSGGAVTLSGALADSTDSGGGISLSGNSGGSTTFNNASKVINTTGGGDAVLMTSSDGHTLMFSGGGLDIDAATGRGLEASNSGTLVVSGTGNTIDTTTGRALNITNTDIGAADATFQRVSSNGAVNGIVLNGTGNGGGLAVTGSGSANSGGLIQSSTGPGISLANVGGGVDLTRMSVTGGADDGVRGSTVDGFTLDNGSVTNNGDVVGEHGLDFTDLTGSVALTSATVTGNAENNLAIVNDSGALDATVTGGSYGSNSTTIGNDGIFLSGTGTGTMTANIQNATFTNNRGDHVQMNTDASTTVTQNLTVNDATMTSTLASVLGGGITFNPGGNATADATLTSNDIQGAADTAIVVDSPGSSVNPQPVSIDATISGNTIGTAGITDSGSKTADGIDVNSNGAAGVRTLIENNAIRQYANLAGINLVMNDGNGTLDATVRANTIGNPGTFAAHGVFFRSGSTGGSESSTTCLDLGHPSTPALKNALTGSGAGGSADIRVRQLANTTVTLPGYGGSSSDTAAVIADLQGRNNPVSTPTASATVSGTGGGFVNGSCTLP